MSYGAPQSNMSLMNQLGEVPKLSSMLPSAICGKNKTEISRNIILYTVVIFLVSFGGRKSRHFQSKESFYVYK